MGIETSFVTISSGPALSSMTAPAALTLMLNADAHGPQSQKYSVSPLSFFRLAEEIAKIFPLRK
jgi:hypothetical protein